VVTFRLSSARAATLLTVETHLRKFNSILSLQTGNLDQKEAILSTSLHGSASCIYG